MEFQEGQIIKLSHHYGMGEGKSLSLNCKIFKIEEDQMLLEPVDANHVLSRFWIKL